jgi:hypothetical protein
MHLTILAGTITSTCSPRFTGFRGCLDMRVPLPDSQVPTAPRVGPVPASAWASGTSTNDREVKYDMPQGQEWGEPGNCCCRRMRYPSPDVSPGPCGMHLSHTQPRLQAAGCRSTLVATGTATACRVQGNNTSGLPASTHASSSTTWLQVTGGGQAGRYPAGCSNDDGQTLPLWQAA